jgi:hypothetical protein
MVGSKLMCQHISITKALLHWKTRVKDFNHRVPKMSTKREFKTSFRLDDNLLFLPLGDHHLETSCPRRERERSETTVAPEIEWFITIPIFRHTRVPKIVFGQKSYSSLHLL